MSFVSADDIRIQFSAAMSAMYRNEVPAYGTLLDIVATVNQHVIDTNQTSAIARFDEADIQRLDLERHGAIRLGTANELNTMRRLFAVMGLFPVDYYDLSAAGIPVHSTAFRPISRSSLYKNPFRVFTSLLRVELIEDHALRDQVETILVNRQIFSPSCLALIDCFEQHGGLTAEQADDFVAAALETFRWHEKALVDDATYQALHEAHRLIADIVSFKGPHINHLTPRTLDIDRCQQAMQAAGLDTKAHIEGPPKRKYPILLRQTSFKALSEKIVFAGAEQEGSHTARFGEIEQRGLALTPKGRDLYDALLSKAKAKHAEQSSLEVSQQRDYDDILHEVFQAFPDDWQTLVKQDLIFVEYTLAAGESPVKDFDQALAAGKIMLTPMIYEDFLPVSAAGIFQSNLGDKSQSYQASSNQSVFEDALGKPVIDGFRWYDRQQAASRSRCIKHD